MLIVDDEEGPRQSLRVVFKSEFDILLADSGAAALELAGSKPVDVAILDIRMAGMSGTELLPRLKELDSRIEVLMLTAFETTDTVKQALRHGACDYLTKPFEISVLREAVANALRRRRLSEAMAESQTRLGTLQHAFQDQSVKEELARTRNEIYESVMHDLGSPLTAISVLTQLINLDLDSTRGDADPAKVREQLDKINNQAGRCLEISRRYLDYARQRAHGVDAVAVTPCLQDVMELVAANPAARNQTLELKQPVMNMRVAINGTDLIQILLNLTINALQATELPHRVVLSVDYLERSLDDEAMTSRADCVFTGREAFANVAPLAALHVVDDGPGIAPANLSKIFTPYFSTKAPGVGTGLGMGIVTRLAANARGAIRVASTPGKGTHATVYLPVVTG